MRNFGYRRCSTNEDKQDVTRQLMGIEIDVMIDEYASGSNEDHRPEFQKLLGIVEQGDHVWFQEISRCGRNTSQLLSTVNKLIEKGVTIHFVTESLVFTENPENPMQAAISKMLLAMLSSVNEMQLAQLKVAVKQGQTRARKEGKIIGAANPIYQANKAAGLHKVSTTRKTVPSAQKQFAADKVKEIITINSSLTLDKIGDLLNNMGHTTQTGKQFTKTSVSKLIKDFGIDRKRLNKHITGHA